MAAEKTACLGNLNKSKQTKKKKLTFFKRFITRSHFEEKT